MPTQCSFCANLSIPHLVSLVEAELVDEKERFYQHHESVQDLQVSAENGCHLCLLFVNVLKGYLNHDPPGESIYFGVHPWLWEGSACELDQSWLPRALNLRKSEVKIRISSRGKGVHDLFRDVEVLDMLSVHIGSSVEDDYQNEKNISPAVYTANQYPILLFKIVVPVDSRLSFSGWRIGSYETDPDLLSETNNCIAQKWLYDCRTKHRNCLEGKLHELPTRVIDVGYPKGTGSGGQIDVILTKDRLESYAQAIAYADLPLTFQDAIKVARSIGIQYLWIDALCIVQDSSRDWEIESKKMGLVYQNSTVTLSALVSTSSEQGIVINETSPTYPASLPIFSKNDGHAETAKLEFFVEREEDLWGLHVTSPLCKRSWCLQESILSPRQLYYGKCRIYWRCPAGYRSADGAAYGRHLPEKYIPNIFAMFHSDLLQASCEPTVVPLTTMLKEFYALVRESSGRELTFVSDRLPALSGVMRRIYEAIPGDYLAGLWSCDAEIIFWQMGCPSKDQTTSSLFTLNLVSQQFQYRDNSDPYGEVTSGIIVVQGRTLPLRYSTQYLLVKAQYHQYGNTHYDEWKVRKQEPHSESRRKKKYIHLSDQTESPYLISFNAYRYGCDFVEKETLEFDSNLICDGEFVALAVRIFEEYDDGELVTCIRGLLLRRLGDSAAQGIDRFERIGMFTWAGFDSEKLVLWQPAELELV